jgi:hypothetical protein
MPTQDQIEAQRQAIYGRLRQYGYPPQQLSDQQVLGTMSNLPQQPVQYPPWAEDWMRRNPQAVSGARPGIDMPSNQTYEDYNLRARALGGSPTQIGYSNAIPRGALIEHYGQPWMDEQDKQWMVEHSTPGATLRLVDPTHPQGYDVHVPGQLPSWMMNPQAPGAPWSRSATGAAPRAATPAAPAAQAATPQQPQQQTAADPWAMFKAGMRAPPVPVHLADASIPQQAPLFADHDATAARYRAMLSA